MLPPGPWEEPTWLLWHTLLVAEEEAEYLRHERVGVEDLLVGLAAAGIGRAAVVLGRSGVEAAILRAAIGRARRAGRAGAGLELDDAARRALGLIDEERAALGHEHAGPEHLLLALVRPGADAPGAPAANLLARLGADPADVRARTLAALAQPSPTPSARPTAAVRPDPSRDGPAPATRLVFFEGIMGAGKSTTGQWLVRELGRHGAAARFLWEGPTREEPEHPLRVATSLPHPGAPWRDLSAEAYAERSLAMWRSFVESAGASPTVTVCDGLLFHGNLTDLVLMDAAPALLTGYVERVLEAVSPLAPGVVYLHQADVAAALRRVSDQRGPRWVDYQVGWKLASPYAERRGLAGYDGLVRLYRDYVPLCLELLNRLALPKLVVERDGDWPRARAAVRAFLRLEDATVERRTSPLV